MTISERLKSAREEAKLTQTEVAIAAGVSQGTVANIESGLRQSPRELMAIAKAVKVHPEWLKSGRGPKRIFEAHNVLPASMNDLVIPQYDAGGSMGNGLILEERQPGIIKSWHVDREWIRHNVPHYTSAENLCIVTGFGPSMRPKYNPGDPLLLDRGVNIVETEGIYFFRVSNHGFIKQLQRIPTEDGMIIRAKSLNKDYDPFDITAKMDFEVFGKVLTVWRSEQV